ncbi:hypothetical protein O181_051038 [Austropuccinia psidii MF-1]|uniref:Cysteine and histidine-rich domain-containing protein 1 n=1 Tax=Austropuccinia psidii MF-1 TaxID=1389203 RepID=A0A9Q3E077_9BASI|nr:hypothetical protein [Austropuccinia psidii MF-1]
MVHRIRINLWGVNARSNSTTSIRAFPTTSVTRRQLDRDRLTNDSSIFFHSSLLQIPSLNGYILTMKTCTRHGCGKPFDPDDNRGAECVFHPGHPVFHEGLKSWSCCKEKNKPVMEFDQFTKIQGCATGIHSLETLKPSAPPPSVQKGVVGLNGKETYAQGGVAIPKSSAPNSTHQTTSDVFQPIHTQDVPKLQPPPPKLDPEDDENSIVPVGSRCKRLACCQIWSGSENSKRGELNKEECLYHPGTPIFHEGSKGYSCCKRRVLDFDDFLKLPGCKRGSHLYLGSNKANSNEEEIVQCRFDYYQTPTSVIVSIFGKNASKETSLIKFDGCTMEVDLRLPSNKRFSKNFALFGEIDPEKSSYKILSTKCEIVLFKSDGRSWSNLEQGDAFSGTVTFGVGGRTAFFNLKTFTRVLIIFGEGNATRLC